MASGTLVVPFWPSSPFWPFLFLNAYNCQPYVVALLVFPSSSSVFELGDYKGSVILDQTNLRAKFCVREFSFKAT